MKCFKLSRFKFYKHRHFSAGYYYAEHARGEWVKFDEVTRLIKRIERVHARKIDQMQKKLDT